MAEHKLINAKGQPSYGVFEPPIDTINHMDFDLRNAMDRKLSKFKKKLQFNQFNFVSLVSQDLILAVAIVDLKIASNCFIYLYETATNKFEEFSFVQPLSRKTRIELQPNNGKSYFRKGENYVKIEANSVAGTRSVNVNLKNGLTIDALIDESTKYNPLQMCSRAGYSGWVFTQKSAALECSGMVNWQGQKYNLKDRNTLASVDWSAGYMRRETYWNWASLACTLGDGRRLGLNLAAGVNETGTSENAFWIDGEMVKVDMVDFQFDRYQKDHHWIMRSNDGKIDIRFEPEGLRKEKMNMLIVASNFTQHFGRYFGTIKAGNEIIELDGIWGFVEDHYAKW